MQINLLSTMLPETGKALLADGAVPDAAAAQFAALLPDEAGTSGAGGSPSSMIDFKGKFTGLEGDEPAGLEADASAAKLQLHIPRADILPASDAQSRQTGKTLPVAGQLLPPASESLPLLPVGGPATARDAGLADIAHTRSNLADSAQAPAEAIATDPDALAAADQPDAEQPAQSLAADLTPVGEAASVGAGVADPDALAVANAAAGSEVLPVSDALIAPLAQPLEGANGNGAQAAAEQAASAEPRTAARPRAVAPSPAELEARRSDAPETMTWAAVERMTAKAPSESSASALGHVAVEKRAVEKGEKDAAALNLRPEPLRETAAALQATKRETAMQSPLPFANGADIAHRIADPASPLAVDGLSTVRTATSATPGTAATSLGQDIELSALVDRLVESRVQARADRSQIDLSHPDFGRVTLALSLRGDDRLAIDLPGAPGELRQAVGQAIGPATRSEASSGQTTTGQENAPSHDRAQADASGNRREQSDRHNEPGRQNDTQDKAAQHQRQQSQTALNSESTGQSAAANRRGVLA